MIRVCYSKFHVGNRVFGEKEPFEKKEETGGLCPICRILEMFYIRKFKMKKKILNWIKNLTARKEG